ncbi:protein phosphatase 1 regulatory subunit 3C-B-like isoform X1 [Myxocyprinus asiaticus]|uniref:protein phosphatase 1 regulatory subunit 3C-B-like isoform X1 n=2 Tax=Myxocyprinus asiaticus TaxID=70543 RepID=UPI002222197E|nr:protein phosphatase 1 regulatory subunit 3C-B-like isoform X1 [Myxocyprinus asiaticus]
MSSTRVLHILSPPMPGPVMPVDVAMQLYITHSPPLHSFLSSYEDFRTRNMVNTCYKPLRPCLSSRAHLEPTCLGWQTPKSKAKKKVVFADSKGMSLTAVHVFSTSDNREPATFQLQYDLEDLEDITATLHINSVQSRILDFPQPAADYLKFRSRLLKNSVCLENCTLQERALTGTIKVRNLAYEKSVHVRITLESWKSYQDVECTFMNNVYGCQDTDTFSFAIELPGYVPPQNKVAFCISYKTGEQTYWDNNDGRNYGLVSTSWQQNNKWNSATQSKKTEPRKLGRKTDNGVNKCKSALHANSLFPKWQSWGHIQTSGPCW